MIRNTTWQFVQILISCFVNFSIKISFLIIKIIKEKVDDAQEISLIDKFIAEVGEDK